MFSYTGGLATWVLGGVRSADFATLFGGATVMCSP